jgi:hypothetical protein
LGGFQLVGELEDLGLELLDLVALEVDKLEHLEIFFFIF